MILYLIACMDSVLDTSEIITDTQCCDTAENPMDWAVVWRSEEEAYATGADFGDIDGDGDLDLIVAEGNDMSPGYIRVYHNRDGLLETEASWVSEHPYYYGHLSLGDVNGDGWIDVAVSRFLGSDRFNEPGGVQVFLNSGGQLESEPFWEESGFFTFSTALGDIDLDGDLDLAVAAGEAYYNDPESSLLFCNDGSGQFFECWRTESPYYSFDVLFADMNGDDWLDLAFANQGEGHTIFFSDEGELPSQPSWQASGASSDFEGNTLDWGDLNGDGWLDLVVSDNEQLGGLGVVRAWCGPDFTLCWTSQDDTAMQSALALHDLDADGDLDLVASAWWGNIRIYENNGTELEPMPVFEGEEDEIVAEAFSIANLQHEHTERLQGTGLLQLPKGARIVSMDGGVSSGGYVSGEQYVVEFTRGGESIFLSDWEPEQGNWLFSIVE